MDNLLTYIAHWAAFGALALIILPKIRWKTQWKRRLFLFACGPIVWFVFGVVAFGTAFGMPIEYWEWPHTGTKRDDYLDGNTQADFDAVNNANANMQMEIIELRLRLARLIKGVRRAQKGKASISDLKL